MTNQRQPILVTGSHRSGSTWVGRMLSASPGLSYIHEPFNLDSYRLGVCGARFTRWMTYLTPESGRAYEPAFAEMLRFRYHYTHALSGARTPMDLVRALTRGFGFLRSRLARKRALIKDPIAIFSAAWLHETFGVQPVVLIRHPGAFVSSLVRLDWRFDFNDLLEQPDLMRDLLPSFEPAIREFAAAGTNADPIEEVAFLWNVIHHVIGVYQQRYPHWIFLRYEDLAADPIPRFEELYRKLGLPFTEKVRRTIWASTNESNPATRDDRTPHVTRLDSKATARSWAKKLTPAQIERIRTITAEHAGRYYDPAEW